MHQIEQIAYVRVSPWPPFKQLEFYIKSVLFGDKISHTAYATCDICYM